MLMLWKFLAPLFGAGMVGAVSDILKKYAEQTAWECDDLIIEIVDAYIDQDGKRLLAAVKELMEYLADLIGDDDDEEPKEEVKEEVKEEKK